MKCPKCGYIGFESVERCRNCGYDFSLALDSSVAVDLPLARDEALGPPDDLTFRDPDTPADPLRPTRGQESSGDPPSRAARRNEGRSARSDLPLFGLGAPTPARQPSTPVPAGAAASRARVTPPSPRLRPRVVAPPDQQPEPQPAELALEADPVRDLAATMRARAGREETGSPPAGSLARGLAGILDVLILGAVNLGVLYFTLRVCRLSFAEVTIVPWAPLTAFFLMLDGAYLVAFTMNGGQTIGKMAASIRVVGEEKDAMTFGQSLVRAVGYFASALPAGLGFVPGLFGPSRRALHDRLANTRVVRA